MSNEGTHRTHCCVIHGCKYGDPDCPVYNKRIKQEFLCEECSNPLYGAPLTFEDVEDVFEAPHGDHTPLKTLEKLHVIEDRKCIYNIHYCKAGVGINFYYPEKDAGDGNWRAALSTDRYYETFEECINAEYRRLSKEEAD